MNRNDITISYREAAVRGASQVELVLMLYDILADDIRGAIAAIRTHDTEARTAESSMRSVCSSIYRARSILNRVANQRATWIVFTRSFVPSCLRRT